MFYKLSSFEKKAPYAYIIGSRLRYEVYFMFYILCNFCKTAKT